MKKQLKRIADELELIRTELQKSMMQTEIDAKQIAETVEQEIGRKERLQTSFAGEQVTIK